MQERAAEGYEPVVQVFLAGREAPIDVAFVTTRRDANEPWVRFEADGPPKGDDDTIPPERFWVHAHDSTILRVEIIYRRKDGASVGFVYNEADDE
jgi:hypothetical protein